MKTIMTTILTMMVFAGSAMAEMTVANVTAQQRYPWNGKVDIVVSITGDVSQIANYECTFIATNCATQAAIPITTISQIGSDSISGDVCTRRYLWNASSDIGAVKIGDVALTVGVAPSLGGVQLWEGGPYWAECNVGATKPEEYGYYFWWGDTIGYKRNANNDGWVSVKDGTSFDFSGSSNCPTFDKNDSQLQSLGYIDSTGNLVAAHDAATQHLGAPWRMPTAAEFDELLDKCDTTWTTENGVHGRLVTGKGAYTSKSIFLPATGYGGGSGLYGTGSYGYYWSSSSYSDSPYNAWRFYFDSSYVSRYCNCRDYGRSVRPLQEFVNAGLTTHLLLDCQTGTRTASEMEQICFSPVWESDAEGAVVTVSVNGVAVTNTTEDGAFEWTPTQNGTYVFTHVVSTNGIQIGETMTTTFVVDRFLSVTAVSAQQRYPWNGKVDIVVTITGDVSQVANYDCAFVATNCATQAAIPITIISQIGSDSISGEVCTRRYLWNASNDVGAVKIDDVALTVDVQKKLGGVQLWEGGPYWAECNVGAMKPEEYGYYFWWGDTVGYKRNSNNDGWISVKDGATFTFSESNCPTYGKDNSQLQSLGYVDSTGNLVAAHDAATAHLGAPWRMPTDAEFSALVSNCDTTWTTKNGVYGGLITGRGAYASKSIFLPAAGYGSGSALNVAGSDGGYWSSSPRSGTSYYAWYLVFGSSYFGRGGSGRGYGQSVRPLRGFANSGVLANAGSSANAGLTTHLSLDCQTDTRTAKRVETITYSSEWESESGEALAIIKAEGEVVNSAHGSGEFDWEPQTNGVYTLTHQVEANGVLVGETLTATFEVSHFPQPPTFTPVSGTLFDETMNVMIKTDTEGATIHYTTNGTAPTVESPVYVKKFRIFGKTTVRAIAVDGEGLCSVESIAEYAKGQCATPAISPDDGTTFEHAGFVVTITGEGVIRYTLDGSEPTEDSAIYTEPFTIDETTTVKAKVFRDDYLPSSVVEATYTRIWLKVASPAISAAATFTGSRVELTMSCATEGAVIHYTLDGSEPTEESQVYEGALIITNSCTLKALAMLEDYLASDVVSKSVTKQWGFGDALNWPNQSYESGGEWRSDTEVTYDGVESLRSGAIGDKQSTAFSTIFSGKGTVSFWWKASCEDAGGYYDCDHGEFETEGDIVKIDGETGWQQVSHTFESDGDHLLTWTYQKDDGESNGCDCVWVDVLVWKPEAALPDLGTAPTVEQVAKTLWGAKDQRVYDRVVTGDDYLAFRNWSSKLTATSREVMDSPHSWLSYALDSAVLLASAPTNGQMKVAAFERNATTGLFDFSVAIEGVSVGEKATADNLATVLGIEGCDEVDGEYKADNVTFNFGTPVDGKVTISAESNDDTADKFFMRVKMAP